ncbi:acetyl-CoA carboxylase biotin carboxyl carrier protein subunit [Aeromicrobium piscarium]|uniref:Biotin/lipoyl-binding protein n=1 Tax=Aeromicrobium piscarium TaxID=2590901 RepID=A0A554SA25_9ACTN|nr:acetyl-CoA carboxylase biotin carboxyl carrier protein subunit [Aeromicrobium piscarium]TSD63204.1 biotin/lipoyl-binding protein [Aeromicrobium piscarium]
MTQMINAEMSASVWRVLVTPGTEVEADEPILILESMKMEIPVMSDGGRVVEIAVSQGEIVQSGQHLVTVDPS